MILHSCIKCNFIYGKKLNNCVLFEITFLLIYAILKKIFFARITVTNTNSTKITQQSSGVKLNFENDGTNGTNSNSNENVRSQIAFSTDSTKVGTKRVRSSNAGTNIGHVDNVPMKKCKSTKLDYTYTDVNKEIEENYPVNFENENSSKEVFIVDPEICDEYKEGSKESEIAYAREWVEFLDTPEFNNDELYDDALDYIDSTI